MAIDMAQQAQDTSIYLDPQHLSCNNGRTFLTCRSCAGNPPRGYECEDCQGDGFNIYVCGHCQHALVSAGASIRQFTNCPSTASAPTIKPSQSSSLDHSPGLNNLASPRNNHRRRGEGRAGNSGSGGCGFGIGTP